MGDYRLDAFNSKLSRIVKTELGDLLKSYTDPGSYGSYGIDEIHLYRLKNKQYAVIIERGCSCYSSDDADVEVFKTRKEAMKYYTDNGGK